MRKEHIRVCNLTGVNFVTSHISDGKMHINVMSQMLGLEDKFLVDSVIEYAKENGFDKVYLLDKEFIMTALENEKKRRGED